MRGLVRRGHSLAGFRPAPLPPRYAISVGAGPLPVILFVLPPSVHPSPDRLLALTLLAPVAGRLGPCVCAVSNHPYHIKMYYLYRRL